MQFLKQTRDIKNWNNTRWVNAREQNDIPALFNDVIVPILLGLIIGIILGKFIATKEFGLGVFIIVAFFSCPFFYLLLLNFSERQIQHDASRHVDVIAFFSNEAVIRIKFYTSAVGLVMGSLFGFL